MHLCIKQMTRSHYNLINQSDLCEKNDRQRQWLPGDTSLHICFCDVVMPIVFQKQRGLHGYICIFCKQYSHYFFLLLDKVVYNYFIPAQRQSSFLETFFAKRMPVFWKESIFSQR